MAKSEILKWDSAFFGFNIAKINDKFIAPADFSEVYQELKNQKIRLVYWPTAINYGYQLEIVNKFNGSLVDIKTTYEKPLVMTDRFNFEDQTTNVGFYKNKRPDARMLDVAVQCGEYSRFKVDSEFPSSKFVKLYRTWIIKSLTGDLADKVIVTRNDDQVSGLITVQCIDGVGNIGLTGVHHSCRGAGLGGLLIRAAINYFIDNTCLKAKVVTQGTNENACRLYEKYGFKVCNQVNFYHFWLS
jgi:dTDP-4-amino-4,6-dideoxy-D-galactose acyltransferase